MEVVIAFIDWEIVVSFRGVGVVITSVSDYPKSSKTLKIKT